MSVRLMYWPNETDPDDLARRQVGGRDGFASLKDQGRLSDLSVYSYRVRRSLMRNETEFADEVMSDIGQKKPDILFVQHVVGSGISAAFWNSVRHQFPRLTIVYHEADPFDRFLKRLDSAAMGLLAVANLTLVSGLGRLRKLFEARTHSPVRYLPQGFDVARFARHDPKRATKQHDIVMIGNRGRLRRLKFLYFPGGRARARLAARLSSAYRERFALYGSGWDHLRSNRGPLEFLLQEETIQSGRISVNWDHFQRIPYYFSNRLAISLAAGVPHVTSHHEGYRHMFDDCPGLYWCGSVSEIEECVHWLLSKSDAQLLEEGMAARAWALANLEDVAIFERALDMSIDVHRRRMERSP